MRAASNGVVTEENDGSGGSACLIIDEVAAPLAGQEPVRVGHRDLDETQDHERRDRPARLILDPRATRDFQGFSQQWGSMLAVKLFTHESNAIRERRFDRGPLKTLRHDRRPMPRICGVSIPEVQREARRKHDDLNQTLPSGPRLRQIKRTTRRKKNLELWEKLCRSRKPISVQEGRDARRMPRKPSGTPGSNEVNVLLTPRAIEQLSDRIERSYLRRHPELRQAGLDPRLWSSAAAILLDIHTREQWVPLDPELFVACQPFADGPSDPWHELTRLAAARNYVVRLRKMVRSLRRELRSEIRRAEVAIEKGELAEVVLLGPFKGSSPLGRYLVACRLNLPDLAERFREPARAQHFASPLYRKAAEGLAPGDPYPVLSLLPTTIRPTGSSSFCLN